MDLTLITLVFYIIFLLINIFAFMYQRTTLLIARKIKNNNSSDLSITDIQMLLASNKVGILGWLSYGVYAACLLIWWQKGLIWAGVGVLVPILLGAILPIPYRFFLRLIDQHLQGELHRFKDDSDEYKMIKRLKELAK